MSEEELWLAFSRACWECGRVQTLFPEYWLCEVCRAALSPDGEVET